MLNFSKRKCNDCSNGNSFLKNLPPGIIRSKAMQIRIKKGDYYGEKYRRNRKSLSVSRLL